MNYFDSSKHLLSIGLDRKTSKGQGLGYLTGILYLAPHSISGVNLCPKATEGCISGCLYKSGNGFYPAVQQARINKARAFIENKELFGKKLLAEIWLLKIEAQARGLKPCVRLNGTSDIAFERLYPSLFRTHSDVQFYDYTKRVERVLANKTPNLHLTFSRSESNEHECLELLKLGHNVAAVFYGSLPESWHGFKVIDGDLSDLRFLDQRGVVVGLKAKGIARSDRTGFVIRKGI